MMAKQMNRSFAASNNLLLKVRFYFQCCYQCNNKHLNLLQSISNHRPNERNKARWFYVQQLHRLYSTDCNNTQGTSSNTNNKHNNNNLIWNNGIPFSVSYNDIYFHINGFEESSYVFVNANNIAERSRDLNFRSLCIVELGFGVGRNFLNTQKCFLENTPSDHHKKLLYFSIEKHPLSPLDLETCLNHPQFSPLQHLKTEFLHSYQSHYNSWKNSNNDNNNTNSNNDEKSQIWKIELSKGSVICNILVGDVSYWINHLDNVLKTESINCGLEIEKVNVWFLDGFKSRSNPAMWEKDVFAKMFSLSTNNTTVSTYSASSHVKRDLKSVGFIVEKRKGFQNKREMLFAYFPKYSPAFLYNDQQKKESVCVIGGGLAACAASWALSEKGFKVRMLERESSLSTLTPPTSVMLPNLHSTLDYMTIHYLNATKRFLHHIDFLEERLKKRMFIKTGALQLLYTDTLKDRFQKGVRHHLHLNDDSFLPKKENNDSFCSLCDEYVQLLSPSQSSHISGIEILYPSAYFPNSGIVYPRLLCSSFLHKGVAEGNIEIDYNFDANELIKTENGNWRIVGNKNGERSEIVSDLVVIANGQKSLQFSQSSWLPLRITKGQMNYLPSFSSSSFLSPQNNNNDNNNNNNGDSNYSLENFPELKTIVFGEAFITPKHPHSPQTQTQNTNQTQGNFLTTTPSTISTEYYTIGSTHKHPWQHNFNDISLNEQDQNEITQKIIKLTPQLKHLFPTPHKNEQASPLLGYSQYRCNTPNSLPFVGKLHPLDDTLFVLAGLGSRGVLHSVLCGEILTDIILDCVNKDTNSNNTNNNNNNNENDNIKKALNPLKYFNKKKHNVNSGNTNIDSKNNKNR